MRKKGNEQSICTKNQCEKYGLPYFERLAVTVFEGDELAAADVEAEEIWKDFGLKNDQIFRYGSRMWPRGQHLSSRKVFPADFPWRSAPHKPVLRRNGNTVYLTL